MKHSFDPNEVRSAYWLSAPALFLMVALLLLPTLAVLFKVSLPPPPPQPQWLRAL